jgi:hypothetical protein
MPPSGKCLRRIAPAAAMVDDIEKKTLIKHNFYLAFARYTRTKKLSNIKTRRGPSTYVLVATSPDSIACVINQVETISYILSYQT